MKNNCENVIIGAGGIGVVVMEVLASTHSPVAYVIDTDPNVNELLGVPVYRELLQHSNSDTTQLLICVSDNRLREQLAHKFSLPAGLAIHNSALISKSSSIGAGSMIFHRSIIQARATIGKYVIINTAAQIDHDCTIGDFVHIAPACVLCGFVTIGSGTNLGANTTVIPGVSIGRNVVTGAGTVVVADLPDNCLAVGAPARVVKFLND